MQATQSPDEHKEKAAQGGNCCQSISISYKNITKSRVLISQCQQPQHLNRLNQLYETFTVLKRSRDWGWGVRFRHTNLGVKPSEWQHQCPDSPRS